MFRIFLLLIGYWYNNEGIAISVKACELKNDDAKKDKGISEVCRPYSSRK